MNDESPDLKLLISNMAAVSAELKIERELRAKEREQGISVTRLHVPFAALLTIVATLVAAGIAGGAFVASTRSHMTDGFIHADRATSFRKGGIAYVEDVKAEVAGAVSDLEAANRRVGRAVRSARCVSEKHGGHDVISCNVPDPETLPLRP